MADESRVLPRAVIDKIKGDGVQVGDKNKNYVFRNCTFNVQHHHHHHHCRCCNKPDESGQDHVTYSCEEEVVVEVVKSVDKVGEYLNPAPQENKDATPKAAAASVNLPVDTVRIVDSWGCQLKIGDVVGLNNIFSYLFPTALYVGNGMIVRCEEKTGEIVKEKLDLMSPFFKRGVTYGRVPVYNRVERVQRAEGRVGDIFTDGHKKDFVCWCFTGVTNMKALQQVIFGS